MQLRDKIFEAGREKTKDFNAVVEVFKDAFPQEVLNSGDWGEAQLINVLPAIKALQGYVDKWNMGVDHMHVSNLKLIYKEMTDMMFAMSFSPEFVAKVDGFADHVNDLRILHENPIPSLDGDEELKGPNQS